MGEIVLSKLLLKSTVLSGESHGGEANDSNDFSEGSHLFIVDVF